MYTQVVFKVAHLFGAIGGGAKGFKKAQAIVGNMRATFRCIGSIDVDAAANRDFQRLVGVPATTLDLFDREQYIAFHGKEPPPGWREAVPADLHRAYGYQLPDVLFLSPPCKGLSGLLPEAKSKTAKYLALNRLTVRGVWLALEAYKDDPVPLFVLENVPRIASRGRDLLDQIAALFRAYGYAWAETAHDCGELGGLAESRKRFLGVARHMEKVPPFLYQPHKKPLKAVGEILGRMPLPGSVVAGPMHRIPRLNWKTWVRLAFVEAGSDWRSLNKLAVEDGVLRDYLIVPSSQEGSGAYGVTRWEDHAKLVAGRSGPTNGPFSVADMRPPAGAAQFGQYGVLRMGDTSGAIIGVKSPGQGAFAVADVRTGVTHNNCFRVVRMDHAAGAVTGGGHPSAGGQAVADPRAPGGFAGAGKYRVTAIDEAAGTVIARSDTGQGAYAVADPHVNWNAGSHESKLHIARWDGPAKPVTGARGPYSGACAIADPRPNMDRGKGDHYLTGGHYGVVPWEGTSYAVSAAACHDNGHWSVADPRPMPEPTDKLVAIIQALDGTWHRPFTTLELGAIQSLLTPEEAWGWDDTNKLAYIEKYGDLAAEGGFWKLDGESDQAHRERIGNAVPPDAAQAIAEVMGETLLLAMMGETFMLSSRPVWVRPLQIAIAVQGA